MLTYISAFIFYTLAMMGVLFVGFIIYKKTFLMDKSGSLGGIKVVDSLSIGPKKMLFIIKIKNERFLIASGDNHTTFLAKLEEQTQQQSLSSVVSDYEQNHPVNNILNQASAQNIYGDNYISKEPVYQARQNYSEVPVEEEIFPEETQRIKQIQRQFKTLYSKDSKTPSLLGKTQEQAQNNKRAVIKKLLKDLNEITSRNEGQY